MAAAKVLDPEEPVIDAIRDGDRCAFTELVRRHDAWVRGVVFGVLGRRDCLDDVCQQVWTNAWRQIGDLRKASSWRSWLYRLARNAAIDAGREMTRRRKRLPATSLDSARAQLETADTEVGVDERHDQVLDAIRALPVLYREPFVMKHMNGWSYKRIAQALEVPVDTVETRLVRARRLLREALKEELL